MVFHSYQFLIFFLVVFALYLSVGHRLQNRLLLVASYVFYGSWDWRFLSLILISSITDYFCARQIHASQDKATRKRYVTLSCVINLGILGFFKYFNFFTDNVIAFFSVFGVTLDVPTLRVILPVGISFYTFQSISYTIDVYRKQLKPADNFLDYAVYVSFFPQLVAGPIERGKHLLPQFLKPRVLRAEQMAEGCLLIFLGIFKKLFIADNLAAIANPIYAENGGGSGGLVLVAAYAFSFQVYADFSAYTDFARGTAKLLGFELMENFHAPYFSRNIQELWNRWHISLTTWIRDYLYYPIAFARFKKRSINPKVVTVIVFMIMGLWHGASWTFVAWGGYNGLILALYNVVAPKLAPYRRKRGRVGTLVMTTISILFTFHVFMLGDVFFRSQSFGQAGAMLYALFTQFELPGAVISQLGDVLFFVFPILLLDFFHLNHAKLTDAFGYPRFVRYAFYYGMFLLVIVYGRSEAAYIYFQF